MVIGLYAGMVLSVTLLLAAITNIFTGKIFKFSSLILITLYFPEAHYSGISVESIALNLVAGLGVMTITLLISALLANAIPMNVIYFIGSVTPWVGTGSSLVYFLITTLLLTSLLVLLPFFLKITKHFKNPPIGFSCALAALIYSPFAVQGMTATGIF